MLQSLAKAIRDLQRAYGRALDSYRPEHHYMRGPGPACLAKGTAIADSALAGGHTSTQELAA